MTKLHVHELTGLKPDALATYLAGLGLFRLLAEQKDAHARGFWRDEHFVLVSEFDWQAIEHFFLENYRPTPILAPWNLESGFFSLKPPNASDEGASETDDARALVSPACDEGEDESDGAANGTANRDEDSSDEETEDDAENAVGDPLLDRMANSKARRFASFQRAIVIARDAIPVELRRAEDDSRRAHIEMRDRLAEARAEYETDERFVETRVVVATAKAEVEAKQAEAKGTRKGTPVHGALRQARQRLKQAEQRLKIESKKLERSLKEREKELKAPIEEAKKRFKAIQSSTKDRLIADLRTRWGDEIQQWVDAAIVLDEKGEAGFTSIFGSGGNDGRMEFTKNFRQHLAALFELETGHAREAAAERLRAALLSVPANLLLNKAVGQFFPGRAGGTNMGAGFFGGAAVNPWEFVLMLEGAIALVAGMTRRGDVGRARVSSPFWVEAASAGFGSASELEGSPRGEQWLPLWAHPLEYGELVELIREGRAQVGTRQTRRAGDLVRATARLGLARGIESLQRFAYLERNGQSNLAVSAGRFRVASRSHQALLEEVAPWIDRLVGFARRTKDNNVPLSLSAVTYRAQEALFAVCRHDATPAEWRDLLVALGDAELALLRSGKNPARRPLPRLSWCWIAAADDGTPLGRTALRLALALASQHRSPEKAGTALQDSIRRHFIPLDESNREWPRFLLDDRGRAERDPELVCVGRDLVTDAIALVRRRSIWVRTSDPERDRAPQLPLWAPDACEATLEEVGAWVRCEVSDDVVYALARPLLALDWSEIHNGHLGSQLPPAPGGVPEPLHLLLRLAHLPFDISIEGTEGRSEVAVTVRLDPEPLRRLAAGDLDGALRVVVRRLGASGLRPVFRRGVAAPGLARRLAASLAFPISRAGAARAARLVCKPYETLEPEEQSAAQA
jgi:CRISPR-associated protein Csx17